MKRKMGVLWHLRERMAAAGMWKTSDLIGPLAERGVQLSREQVYRLVTGQPERLNVYVLAALCDILDCGPGDLIEPVVEARQVRKRANGGAGSGSGSGNTLGAGAAGRAGTGAGGLRPVRARVAGASRTAPPRAD